MSKPVAESFKTMKVFVEIGGARREVDLGRAFDIGIVLDFEGEQPQAFGLAKASATVVAGGTFVGDTRQGGSVNCEGFTLYPHGNGTHTEGVGHITKERISVADVDLPPLMAATLLSVPLRRLGQLQESYEGRWGPADLVVSAADLREAAARVAVESEFLQAIVLRVERGAEFIGPKANHSGINPPYLTGEAVQWLREVGCDHLLVELPSIDREDDGGTVPNHRLFFGAFEEPVSKESRQRTITELVQTSPHMEDGPFVLSLRLPRLRSDAVPSRPVLYPFKD